MKKVLLVFLALLFLSGCSNNQQLEEILEQTNNLKREVDEHVSEVDSLNEDYHNLKDIELVELQDNTNHIRVDIGRTINMAESVGEELDVIELDLMNELSLLSEKADDYFEKYLWERCLCAADERIQELLDQLAIYEIPIIYGIEEYEITVNETLIYSLNAYDHKDGDISDDIYTEDMLTFDETGEYIITFLVKDSDGNIGSLEVVVNVK